MQDLPSTRQSRELPILKLQAVRNGASTQTMLRGKLTTTATKTTTRRTPAWDRDLNMLVPLGVTAQGEERVNTLKYQLGFDLWT